MADKIKTVASFDADNPGILTVKWYDKETTTYTWDSLPEDIQERLCYHGLKQILMDEHSGGLKTYGSIAGCRQATDIKYARLEDGEWSAERATSAWMIDAMVDVFEIVREAAEITYADEDKRKKVAKHPGIKAWKSRRDLARAEAELENAPDLDDLF